MLTPASVATSSRRSPGVRRRPESGRPTSRRLQLLAAGPEELSRASDRSGTTPSCLIGAPMTLAPAGTRINPAFLAGRGRARRLRP